MKFRKIAKLGVLLSVPMLCLSLLGEEAKAEDYIYSDLMEKQSLAFEDLAEGIKEKYNVDDDGVYDVIDELGFIYYEGETLYFVVEDKNINQKYSLRAASPAVSAVDLENDNVEIITSKTIQPSELKNALEEINQLISEDSKAVNASSAIMPDKMKIEIEYNILNEDVIKEIKGNYAELVEFKLVKSENEDYKTKFDDWNKLGGGLGINNNCTATAIAYKGGNHFLLTAGHCLNSLNTTQYQNKTAVGVSHSKANYAKLDAGLIRINSSALSGGRYATNGIKVTKSSSGETFDNKFINTASAPHGAVVAKSGITTDKTEGVVNGSMRDLVVDGETRNLIKVDRKAPYAVAAKPGDSGAPVYIPRPNGNVLVGILSSGPTNGRYTHYYYSDITKVRNHYGISIYTSPANTKLN